MPCFEDSYRKLANGANRVNLLRAVKKPTKRKPILRCISYCICKKAIKKLKSVGGITIRFHISEWDESEMTIGVHCDTAGILTKGV